MNFFIISALTVMIRTNTVSMRLSSWPALDSGKSDSELTTEAKVLFSKMDSDSKGTVTFENLVSNVSCSDNLLRKIFYKLDKNYDGYIDESEFINAYLYYPTLRGLPLHQPEQ